MRIYLIIIGIFITCLSTNAQKTFGIKAGLGTSIILIKNNSEINDIDFVENQHFGFVKKFPLKYNCDLLLDLLWSKKGGKLFFHDNYATINLNYISLPIYVNYNIQKFSLGIGLEPSFKIRTVVQGVSANEVQKALFERTFSQNFNTNLFTSQSFIWKNIYLENRVGVGLQPLTKYNCTDENGNTLIHENTGTSIWLQFSLGYFFK